MIEKKDNVVIRRGIPDAALNMLGIKKDEAMDVKPSMVKVITKFNADLISQEVLVGKDLYGHQDIISRICNNIVRLQDDGVRKALIKLGWTPPKS